MIKHTIDLFQEALYDFCASHNDMEELVDVNELELPGDKTVGSFTTLCPKTFFLVEDLDGVCGYVAAVPDNKRYMDEFQSKWIPEMKEKYINSEHIELPIASTQDWQLSSSSHIVFKLNSKVRDECVVRRILYSALSVLKASGATTVYHQLQNDIDLDMYVKLGFYPIDNVPGQKLLWRNL